MVEQSEAGTSANAQRKSEGQPTLLVSEIEQLLALIHRDPHSLLGAHPVDRGVIVRTFRPDAEKVEILACDEPPRELAKIHSAGLFELLFADRKDTFKYQLRVSYADGYVVTLGDPYAFLPTLGSFDEHLFGEGRHERLYDKLGAHVREVDGV